MVQGMFGEQAGTTWLEKADPTGAGPEMMASLRGASRLLPDLAQLLAIAHEGTTPH